MSGLSQEDANVQATKAGALFAKAQAVRQLVDGGFSHESAIKAVNSGDLTLAQKAA